MKGRFDGALTALAVALPLLWLIFLRVGLMPVGESCFDPYYHVYMADAGPKTIFAKSFPATTMSLWEHSFSDKEALYHLALSAIRKTQAALGMELGWPFHFPALLFDAFALASFVAALRLFGVGWRALLFASTAFVLLSPAFTMRLLLLRPHVVSIALLCLAFPLFAQAKGRLGWTLCFAFGALYSWTYSNPHFALLPAFCMGLARLRGEGWRNAFAPALLCGAGALFAQIAHPQFPNTVYNWWVQCVDVIANELRQGRAPIAAPEELLAPKTLWFLANAGLYLLFAFDLALVLTLRLKRGLDAIPVVAQGLFAASAIAIAGTFFSARAIEYALPFTLMSCATLGLCLKASPEAVPKSFRLSRAGLLATLGALAILAAFEATMLAGGGRITPPAGLAKWAAKTGALPPGTKIANIAWSDFPTLNYALPGRRYLCGLDPMFAYRRFPERFLKIEKFRVLDLWLSPAELAEASDSAFAFVRKRDSLLAKSMLLGGYEAAYKGPDGWLFKLPKRNPGEGR